MVELTSTTTVHVDLGVKKDTYEQILKTPEYVIYNPYTKELLGWRLTSGHYQPIKPNQNGWLWCDEIGLWLGVIEHDFPRAVSPVKPPRFFDKNGQLVLTRKEVEAQQKKIETRRADQAEKRAKAEAQKRRIAEKEKEAEAKARSKAEAEVVRLQALLDRKNN